MNKIYSKVWNKALGQLVVASEFAKSDSAGVVHGAVDAAGTPRRHVLVSAVVAALTLTAGFLPQAFAQDAIYTRVTTGDTVLDTNGVQVGTTASLTATGLVVDDDTGNESTVAATGIDVTDGTSTTTLDSAGVQVGPDVALGSAGLTIAGGPSMTATGIDAGNAPITSVAAGTSPTDAVNVDQLGNTINANRTRYYSVNDDGVQGGNYDNDGATGVNALAAGVGASAAAADAVAIGTSASADAAGRAGSIAIGQNASAVIGPHVNDANGYTGSIAIGQNARSIGGSEVVIGVQAGQNAQRFDDGGKNIWASDSVLIGSLAGRDSHYLYATYVGDEAGRNSQGEHQTAVGQNTLRNTRGSSNTALGSNALAHLSGAGTPDLVANTGLGTIAGANAIGNRNTWSGYQAGWSTHGNFNTASGVTAGLLVVGDGNTASGAYAGREIIGSGNVALGQFAGSDVTGDPTINPDGWVSGVVFSVLTVDDTVAIGNRALASADDAVAVGHNALVTAENSVALGADSIADGATLAEDAYSPTGNALDIAGIAPVGEVSVGSAGSERRITHVAAGSAETDAVNVSQLQAAQEAATTHYYSVNDDGVQGGNYDNDGATGVNALAAGVDAEAEGSDSVAIGSGAVATGNPGSTLQNLPPGAVDNEATTGQYAVAIGHDARALGDSTIAIGRQAGTAAQGSRNILIGEGAGQSSETSHNIFIGERTGEGLAADPDGNAGAPFLRGHNVALGMEALQAGVVEAGHGENNTAIGLRAGRWQQGSSNTHVGSFAGVAQHGDLNFNAGYFAGQYTDSFGSVNIGIEAGAGSPDARVEADYAVSIGVQARALANDGISIGRGSQVPSASGVALGMRAKTLNEGDVALGAGSVTADANPTGNGTVGGITYGTFSGSAPTSVVSVGDVGAERQITNVAAGRISAASTDAINGSQLFATQAVIGNVANSVVDVLGGNAGLGDDGTITTEDIGNTGHDNIHDAIDAVNTAANAGWNLSAQGENATNVAPGDAVDLNNTDGNIVVAKADDSNDVTFDLADDVEIGNSLTIGDTYIDGDSITTTHLTAGGETRLGDNFVVNGGGVTYTGPITDGDHIVNKQYVDGVVGDVATTPITFAGNTGSTDVALGETLLITGEQTTAGAYSGANLATEVDETTGELSLLFAQNPEFTSVITGDTVISSGGVQVGPNVALDSTGLTIVGGPSVTTAGIDAGNKTITNVAPGVNPTDAVNLDQLNEGVTSAVEQSYNYTDERITEVNTSIENLDNRVTTVEGDVLALDNRVTTVEGNVENLQTGADGMFQVSQEGPVEQPQPTGVNSAAGGNAAVASGDNSLALGNQSVAGGDNGTAIGQDAVASHDNSVALGQGSATTVGAQQNYDAAYVGASASSGEVNVGNRTISGMAPGIVAADAVNVRQLNAGVNHAIVTANEYTDTRFNHVQDDIWNIHNRVDGLERDLNAGIATAMSLRQAPYVAGATTYYAGFGTYKDEAALGVSLRRTADNGRWSLEGGFSANREGTGAYVGVSGVLGGK